MFNLSIVKVGINHRFLQEFGDKTTQSVICWGPSSSSGWSKIGAALSKVDVRQLESYHRGLLGLTNDGGRLFFLPQDENVGQQPPFVRSTHRFVSLSTSTDGRHCLALTEEGAVVQFEIHGAAVTLEGAVVHSRTKDFVKVSAGAGNL